MTAVHAALAKRFPGPEWATFFEVKDDAGSAARRSADCVAMNVWPSRGLKVHGVEVKVDRRDWLRELKDPAKSASIQRYCDFWWLAVGDAKVAKVEEVPETWGLLVLRGASLVAVKEAPQLKPALLQRGFVAALLRNAHHGMVPQASVDDMVQKRVASYELALDRVVRAHKALVDRVTAFEESSGLSVTGRFNYGPMSDPSKLGRAVRALLNAEHDWENPIAQAKRTVAETLRSLEEAHDALKAARPKIGDGA